MPVTGWNSDEITLLESEKRKVRTQLFWAVVISLDSQSDNLLDSEEREGCVERFCFEDQHLLQDRKEGRFQFHKLLGKPKLNWSQASLRILVLDRFQL